MACGHLMYLWLSLDHEISSEMSRIKLFDWSENIDKSYILLLIDNPELRQKLDCEPEKYKTVSSYHNPTMEYYV
jgi:hypothetical protein